MLTPETPFRGRNEDQSQQILEKIFRRYSRCEDILLSPEKHVAAIKERFCLMFQRSAGRPILHGRLGQTAWAIAELDSQVNNGKPSSDSIDIGLADKSIVKSTFLSVRENIKPPAVPELKRA